MTTGQIKGALHDLGITHKAIAAQIGKSQAAVSKVIRMEMVSDPIMRAIAGRLGREPWDVFDYYRSSQSLRAQSLRKPGQVPRAPDIPKSV
jgi:transcriptional regulator with XRE-family HTH domain